jgi:hypothetical protein
VLSAKTYNLNFNFAGGGRGRDPAVLGGNKQDNHTSSDALRSSAHPTSCENGNFVKGFPDRNIATVYEGPVRTGCRQKQQKDMNS